MAKVTTKPTVRLTQKAWQKIWALTEECKIEVSAMGHVATDAQRKEWGIDEKYYVLDIHVIDQECGPGSTELDQEGLADLVASLREEGIKGNQLIFWWHSHVNMDTGHSGTDEAQIESFDSDTALISMITNKRGDVNMRVDVMEPFRYSFEGCSYAVDQLPIIEDDWAEKMIEDHVTVSRPQTIKVKRGNFGKNSWTANGSKKKKKKSNTSYGGYGGYQGYWDDDDWAMEWNSATTEKEDKESRLVKEEDDATKDEEMNFALQEVKMALETNLIEPEEAALIVKALQEGKLGLEGVEAAIDGFYDAALALDPSGECYEVIEEKNDSSLFDDYAEVNNALAKN